MPNGESSFKRRHQSQPRLASHAAQHSRLGEQIDGLLENRNASENQSNSAYSKSIRIQNFKSRTATSRKRSSSRRDTSLKNLPNVAGFEHDYLSATDPEDYQDRISLKNLSKSEKEAHLLRLWRTCYNCSFGVAMMLSQKEALTTKITLFGRQLVAQ